MKKRRKKDKVKDNYLWKSLLVLRNLCLQKLRSRYFLKNNSQKFLNHSQFLNKLKHLWKKKKAIYLSNKLKDSQFRELVKLKLNIKFLYLSKVLLWRKHELWLWYRLPASPSVEVMLIYICLIISIKWKI